MKQNSTLNVATKMLVMAMVAIFNFVAFTSCQENEEAQARVMKNSFEPVVPDADWQRNRIDDPKGNKDDYTITLIDRNSDEKHTLTGKAKLSCEKYDYAIFEEHKNLDVAYSNANKVMGETMLLPTDTGFVAITNVVFPLEDGNTVTVSDTCIRVNGAPYDVLEDVILTSLNNVTPAQTRAAYYEKERLNTEVVAQLTYHTEGMDNEPKTTVSLKDMVIRHLMEEDDIQSASSKDKDRKIIDNTTEKCFFTEVFTMKSGEKNEVPRSYVLYREFKGIDPYDLIVDNFTYTFSQSYGVTPGEAYSVPSADTNWTVKEVEDRYNAFIAGPKGVTTLYTLKHQGCEYSDKWGVKETFEILPVEVSEAGTNVAEAYSDKANYDKAVLTNNVNTLYGGYNQALSEFVNLYKEAKHETYADFDKSTAKKEFTENTMICSIDFVTRYSDGEEIRTNLKHVFTRSLICTSNWMSIENSNNNSTAGAALNISKASKKDAEWAWTEERGSIVANVTLAGSKKQNTWESTEANSVTISYKGKTYSFGTDQYTLQNAASVASGVEKDGFTEYKYSDVLSYKFGDANAKSVAAPGLIKVEIEENPFFPKEWGKLLSATETVAPNETRKDYVYTWSLHFEKGTLPVVVRRGSLAPEWKFEYFSSETDSRFNGGYYLKSTKSWVNTIAADGTDWMEWLNTANQNKGNMAYSTATAWGWDEGHQKSGHPSVHTSRHTLTVNNGELKAKDTYLNKAMTDSHVNKNGGWK